MDTIKQKLSAPTCQEPVQIRSGTWTKQEEDYVHALIKEFRDGHLDINEGTSLRGFLAKMLDCKPKRISKKYGKTDYNGGHLYTKNSQPISHQEMQERHMKLKQLELKYRESLTADAAAGTAASRSAASGAPSLLGLGSASSITQLMPISNDLSALQRQALVSRMLSGQQSSAANAFSDSLLLRGVGATGLDASTLELLAQQQRLMSRESAATNAYLQQRLLLERAQAGITLDSLGNSGTGTNQLESLLAAQRTALPPTSTASLAGSQSLLAGVGGLNEYQRLGLAAPAPAATRDLLQGLSDKSNGDLHLQSQDLQAIQRMLAIRNPVGTSFAAGGAPSSSELERALMLQRCALRAEAIRNHNQTSAIPVSDSLARIEQQQQLQQAESEGKRESPLSDGPANKRPRLDVPEE